MDSEANKKPKGYYVDYSRGGRHGSRFRGRGGGAHTSAGGGNARFRSTPDLSFGTRGFLITSADEVKSYLEMRNILEANFEKLYGTELNDDDDDNNSLDKTHQQEASAKPKQTQDDPDDIEAELRKVRLFRPFKQVKTHCRNTLFLKIMSESKKYDPNSIVERLFGDLQRERKIKCSNTFKVLPILDTFRNTTACAQESISNLIVSRHFEDADDPKKFFIEFQSRGNYKMDSDERVKMIEGVAKTIVNVRPYWTVSRDEADYMFVLIALKDVCCISIVKNYFERCKYNVDAFCKDFEPLQVAENPDSGDNNETKLPDESQGESVEAAEKSEK